MNQKLNTKTPTKDGISNSGPTPSTIETNKNKNQSQSDSTNVPTNTNRNPKNKKFNNSSNTNTTNTSTTNTSTTSTGKTFAFGLLLPEQGVNFYCFLVRTRFKLLLLYPVTLSTAQSDEFV